MCNQNATVYKKGYIRFGESALYQITPGYITFQHQIVGEQKEKGIEQTRCLPPS